MTEKIIQMAYRVDNGTLNPLDAYCELNRIENLCAALKKQIQQQAVNEAQKHGKTFKHMGFEIQCRAGAGRWKFDHIDEWVVVKNQLAAVEDMAKWAYKSEEKGVLPVTDGGEIIQPAVYVAGSDTIALKEIEKWQNRHLERYTDENGKTWVHPREKKPNILVEMIKAKYNRHCPKIDWNS